MGTTAQLEALASITKAPSTSALITAAKAAKKASGNSSVYNSGGTNNRSTPKFGSAASATKFSSRICRSPMKKTGATKSASKVGPSGGLLNLKSFLPGKVTVQKPTEEELQQKKVEELRLKEEKEEAARKRKDEQEKAKQEE